MTPAAILKGTLSAFENCHLLSAIPLVWVRETQGIKKKKKSTKSLGSQSQWARVKQEMSRTLTINPGLKALAALYRAFSTQL